MNDNVSSYATARLAQVAPEVVTVINGPKPIFKCELSGPAVTCICEPGDNLALHRAIVHAPRGSIIVCRATENLKVACFGELMATDCKRAGISGVVIDGAIRDAAHLPGIGLPVFASAVSPLAPRKAFPGLVQVPLALGGVKVNPGDWIAGDADGVICIPSDAFEEVRGRYAALEQHELEIAQRLAAGERLFRILEIVVPR